MKNEIMKYVALLQMRKVFCERMLESELGTDKLWIEVKRLEHEILGRIGELSVLQMENNHEKL